MSRGLWQLVTPTHHHHRVSVACSSGPLRSRAFTKGLLLFCVRPWVSQPTLGSRVALRLRRRIPRHTLSGFRRCCHTCPRKQRLFIYCYAHFLLPPLQLRRAQPSIVERLDELLWRLLTVYCLTEPHPTGGCSGGRTSRADDVWATSFQTPCHV